MENLENKKNKKSLKWKIIIILLVLFSAVLVYGYFWYRSVRLTQVESQAVMQEAQKYDILITEIKAERNRCENFIAQREGDFGSFEYCQKFIDWSERVNKK